MTRMLVGTVVTFTVAASAFAAQDGTRLEELQRHAERFAQEAAARRPIRRCGMPVAPAQPAGDRMGLAVRPDTLAMPMAAPRCDESRARRQPARPAGRPVERFVGM